MRLIKAISAIPFTIIFLIALTSVLVFKLPKWCWANDEWAWNMENL